MGYLYIDTSAVLHAYRAGGINLLDKYAQLAKAKDLRLVVTDVVLDELFVRSVVRGRPGQSGASPDLVPLEKWLAKNAAELTTRERGLLEDFRAGRLAEYTMDDRGERSIVEHLLSDADAHESAIFSDDTKFPGKLTQWLREGKGTPADLRKVKFNIDRIVCTNPDMLASACKERIIHIPQHGKLVQSFRESCLPYNKDAPASYSRALDERFCDEGKLKRLRAGKAVAGARILGAFGRLMAATGVAFVALDTMTTAAQAATQLRDGDNEGAAQTVAEFGGRMAGAMAGAEGGAFVGAMLGSVVPGLGTTIGAIAGGAIGGMIGATVGERAAKAVIEGVNGTPHPTIDPRLVDDSMRNYAEPEISALQKELYAAGYSNEEVNYVCSSVRETGHEDASGSAGLPEAFASLADNIPNFEAGHPPIAGDASDDPSPSTATAELDVHAELVDRSDAPGPHDDGLAPPPEPPASLPLPQGTPRGNETIDPGSAPREQSVDPAGAALLEDRSKEDPVAIQSPSEHRPGEPHQDDLRSGPDHLDQPAALQPDPGLAQQRPVESEQPVNRPADTDGPPATAPATLPDEADSASSPGAPGDAEPTAPTGGAPSDSAKPAETPAPVSASESPVPPAIDAEQPLVHPPEESTADAGASQVRDINTTPPGATPPHVVDDELPPQGPHSEAAEILAPPSGGEPSPDLAGVPSTPNADARPDLRDDEALDHEELDEIELQEADDDEVPDDDELDEAELEEADDDEVLDDGESDEVELQSEHETLEDWTDLGEPALITPAGDDHELDDQITVAVEEDQPHEELGDDEIAADLEVTAVLLGSDATGAAHPSDTSSLVPDDHETLDDMEDIDGDGTDDLERDEDLEPDDEDLESDEGVTEELTTDDDEDEVVFDEGLDGRDTGREWSIGEVIHEHLTVDDLHTNRDGHHGANDDGDDDGNEYHGNFGADDDDDFYGNDDGHGDNHDHGNDTHDDHSDYDDE
jgi:hypothetical protein